MLNKIKVENDYNLLYKEEFLNIEREKLIDLWKQTKELILIKEKDGISNFKDDSRHRAIWFGSVDYKYNTGKGYYTHKKKEMPEYILNIAKQIEKEIGLEDGYFNSVLINWYNSNEGIGKHQDNEDALLDSNKQIGYIGVFSLGGKSKITISKADKTFVPLSLIADHNSLYIMPNGNFQHEFLHQVGKSDKQRISFTFRKTY
jgi:alkylated DNA repair dioxygenase AlkB